MVVQFRKDILPRFVKYNPVMIDGESWDPDDVYRCKCGVAVPYPEATERMMQNGLCEDCASQRFDQEEA